MIFEIVLYSSCNYTNTSYYDLPFTEYCPFDMECVEDGGCSIVDGEENCDASCFTSCQYYGAAQVEIYYYIGMSYGHYNRTTTDGWFCPVNPHEYFNFTYDCSYYNYSTYSTYYEKCPFEMGCSPYGCSLSQNLTQCSQKCATDCTQANETATVYFQENYDTKWYGPYKRVVDGGYYCPTGFDNTTGNFSSPTNWTNASEYDCAFTNDSGTFYEFCPFNMSCASYGCSVTDDWSDCWAACGSSCTNYGEATVDFYEQVGGIYFGPANRSYSYYSYYCPAGSS